MSGLTELTIASTHRNARRCWSAIVEVPLPAHLQYQAAHQSPKGLADGNVAAAAVRTVCRTMTSATQTRYRLRKHHHLFFMSSLGTRCGTYLAPGCTCNDDKLKRPLPHHQAQLPSSFNSSRTPDRIRKNRLRYWLGRIFQLLRSGPLPLQKLQHGMRRPAST